MDTSMGLEDIATNPIQNPRYEDEHAEDLFRASASVHFDAGIFAVLGTPLDLTSKHF